MGRVSGLPIFCFEREEAMSWPRWQSGRQGTGYRKLCLFKYGYKPGFACDCWIIDYPAGTSIPTHTDPVPGKRHYRINILLWGEDKFVGDALFKSKHITFFRPDIMPHAVSEVSTRRIILSFGWVRG